MTEQMRACVVRSLEARIVQCTTCMEVLRDAPQTSANLEAAAYWRGEREAAMAAIQTMHAPEFGA